MKLNLMASIDRRARRCGAIGCAPLLWLAAAAAPALAAVPPSVVTGPATQVQFASAAVTGTVNPDGLPTTSYFQYGPTVAYGRQTSAAAAGSGTAPVRAGAALSGLAPSTTYHYRLVAASAAGTVDGRDATFATPKTPPPAVATGRAGSLAAATAVVTGTVNPEGLPTTFHFQYGPTAAYGRQTPAAAAGAGTAPLAVRQSLSGLAAGTAYHYRLVGVSAGGTVVGRDATFVTTRTAVAPKKAPAVAAPAAVTGPATALTPTTAVLTGSLDPRGVAASFYFQYGTRALSARTPAASAGAGSAYIPVSAPLVGLVPGARYVYRLVATGAHTTVGATRAFTTPRIPLGLSLSASANPVSAGASVTFGGTLSGTGAGVRTVALEVDPYPFTGGFVRFGNPELPNAAGAFAFTLPGLTANTHVRAVTLSGSPALASTVIAERVFVRVTLNVRRHGRRARLAGLINPTGAPVQIRVQRRVGHRWVTIARTGTRLNSAGQEAYGRTFARPHPGRYRVVAHMLNGSLLTAGSRAVTLH